jgi:hypothetical protein
MKTKQISIREYIITIDPNYFRISNKYPDSPVTHQAIKYRIKKGMDLPEVIKYDKIGKVHVLTVREDF